ncbi:hypothetical protein [Labrys wisconsinensis]|uniref:Uncharacterized protein n=1 Tax=Labrys wisconsinensis TaxID=425677 RepID=A0ABU0JHE7_9HYPH|nr:hypothetical protein [Labrys wisconsinensis]MDQ0472843.1 hypothetical protein [Labrys wisconsinensis]
MMYDKNALDRCIQIALQHSGGDPMRALESVMLLNVKMQAELDDCREDITALQTLLQVYGTDQPLARVS